ncbi:MAG: hypothetical protein PHC30_03225 [Lentisphaeria bacterium]|nr:hypothetical protein [Lentisphaeria bacterium]
MKWQCHCNPGWEELAGIPDGADSRLSVGEAVPVFKANHRVYVVPTTGGKCYVKFSAPHNSTSFSRRLAYVLGIKKHPIKKILSGTAQLRSLGFNTYSN